MSLAAIIDAMIASGCTPSQIGAAVRAAEDEAEVRAKAEITARRAKAAEKKALQRAAANAREAETDVPHRPQMSPGQQETSGDDGGRKERPHTPKENPPPPSDPLKGSSVGAPRGASRGHRLPDDFAPNDSDLDYGGKLGLRPAEIASSLEDMQRWAWANTGAKVRKLDWHMTFKGFLKRDAGRLARAGPSSGNGRSGRTVSDLANMNLDDPDIFDDHQRADTRDGAPESASPADETRSGFAGRLSEPAAHAARRGALIDH